MVRYMKKKKKILLKIESEYLSTALIGLDIDGYDDNTVAYHCKIMEEAGLISSYEAHYAANELWLFTVGSLTWDGCDYLDKIRDDSVWNKTKETIGKEGLPLVFDTIKTVSSAFVTAAAEGVANAILKNGGQV